MTKKFPIKIASRLSLIFLGALLLASPKTFGNSVPSDDPTSKRNVQPEKSALDPMPEALSEESLDSTANSPQDKDVSATSFLMDKTVLSAPSASEQTEKNSGINKFAIKKQPLKPTPQAAEIIFPISQSCNASNSLCKKIYSDGSISSIHSHQEFDENEFRQITTIEETDANKHLKATKSIYQGTQYSDPEKTRKEFEFFEISHESQTEPKAKEILIYDYYPGTNQVKKVTWGEYVLSGSEAEEKLVSHAFLTYHSDGSPDKGLAESLEDGFLTAQFLGGGPSQTNQGFASLDQEAWKGWENWITTRRLSFYVS